MKKPLFSNPRPEINIFVEEISEENWKFILIRNRETLMIEDGYFSEDDALEAAIEARLKINKRYPQKCL
jgi:hypothetical protein